MTKLHPPIRSSSLPFHPFSLFLLLSPITFHKASAGLGESLTATTTDPFDWELPPSVFGSNGRLFAVDTTMRAVEDVTTSTVAVALSCTDGVAVVCSLPRSPYLYMEDTTRSSDVEVGSNETVDGPKGESDGTDTNRQDASETLASTTPSEDSLILTHASDIPSPFSFPPFLRLRPHLFGVLAGQPPAWHVLHQAILASSHTSTSAAALSRYMADVQQQATQRSDRTLQPACILLWDTNNGIWRIDPTGQFWSCRGAVVGANARRVEEKLLEELLGPQKGSWKEPSALEAIVMARDSILSSSSSSSSQPSPSAVLESSQKGRRLVAVVTKQQPDGTVTELYTHDEIMNL